MVGYVVPSLQYLGIVWSFVMLADLPISLVSFLTGWKYGLFAVVWTFVVGTLWWYLLSRTVEFVVDRFKDRRESPLDKLNF